MLFCENIKIIFVCNRISLDCGDEKYITSFCRNGLHSC